MRRAQRNRTKFIELDTHKCEACWECVQVCPNHVLGKVAILTHRHAHIVDSQACKGCKKCVDACARNAIRYTYVPAHRAYSPAPEPPDQPAAG